jgi:hypothetical protein
MSVNADLSFATRLEAVEAPQRIVDRNDIDVAAGIFSANQGVDIGTAQERLRQAATRPGITERRAARAVPGLLTPWKPDAPLQVPRSPARAGRNAQWAQSWHRRPSVESRAPGRRPRHDVAS